MAEMTVEEFENKCMDIIEQIVSSSIRLNRKGAIAMSEKMLEKAKLTGKKKVVEIYERVVHEFKIATDAEYEMLRKQIFGDGDKGNK